MKKEKFISALGLRVKKSRTEKGVSLYGLAQKIKKAPFSIQRLEQGKINPSLYYLYQIAEGLSISLEELVKGLP